MLPIIIGVIGILYLIFNIGAIIETQYSSSVIYEPVGTLVNDESVGKVIDKAIKDVYAEKDGYDEDQVRAKLIEMKKKIAESEDLLFEKKYCQ